MRPIYRPLTSRLNNAFTTTGRFASSSTRPPEPRRYKPHPRDDHPAPNPSQQVGPPKEAPLRTSEPEPEPRDPTRGLEAAQRVVRDGVLDERYRGAARKYTAVLCALPIAIYLSYELYRRLILGVEQKGIPKVKARKEVEVVGEQS